jgi:hypothetical protein
LIGFPGRVGFYGGASNKHEVMVSQKQGQCNSKNHDYGTTK